MNTQRPESQQRLFFALWPDVVVRSQLDQLKPMLSTQKGRLTHPEDWHLTLVFLGNVAVERLPCIHKAAEQIDGQSFELYLDRIGYWSRSRILWAAPSTTPTELIQLVTRLQQQLAGCGFEPEQRPYAPHLTLARHTKPVTERSLSQPIAWEAKTFALVATHPPGKIPRYRVLRDWILSE